MADSSLRALVVTGLAFGVAMVVTAVVMNDQPLSEPPPRAPSPHQSRLGGSVLFSGDFNTGDLSQWGVVHSQTADRVTVGTSNPSPFEGVYRARFEVRPGDGVEGEGNRAEVTAPQPAGWFAEGQERWVRQSVYVPSQTLESDWKLITQYSANGVGSPALAMFLVGGSSPHFELRHGDSSTTDWVGPKLKFDRWYDIAVHVRYSSSPATGFIEVYLEGAKQTLTNGQTRRHRTTMEHGKAYLKVGIYRNASHSSNNVVYHDNVVVSGP